MKEDAGSTFSAPDILMASESFLYILYDGQSRETRGLFAVNYVTVASSPEN